MAVRLWRHPDDHIGPEDVEEVWGLFKWRALRLKVERPRSGSAAPKPDVGVETRIRRVAEPRGADRGMVRNLSTMKRRLGPAM